jgi:hypothetical protein
MRIEIKAVDPIALREKSAWLKDGSLQVLVPDYGRNHDGAFLVGLYELVKAWQCHKAHIPEGAVKLKQEIVAAEVERHVADALEIDWEQHEKWVENSYDEVARSSAIEAPRILLQGPRAWESCTSLHYVMKQCVRASVKQVGLRIGYRISPSMAVPARDPCTNFSRTIRQTGTSFLRGR